MHARKFSPFEQVPDDFPQEPWPAAIGGSQTKYSARQIDGKYVVGLTPHERQERYRICMDVVEQLLVYCRSKLDGSPQLKPERLLIRVSAALLVEAPDLSLIEQAWCLAQVKERL